MDAFIPLWSWGVFFSFHPLRFNFGIQVRWGWLPVATGISPFPFLWRGLFLTAVLKYDQTPVLSVSNVTAPPVRIIIDLFNPVPHCMGQRDKVTFSPPFSYPPCGTFLAIFP